MFLIFNVEKQYSGIQMQTKDLCSTVSFKSISADA